MSRLLKEEIKRQEETLGLIPSENIASRAVMETLGSPLTNKYSEGYPDKRYYGGNGVIDKIEKLAQERTRKVFRLGSEWHVNVQPYSGSPANMAVYYALLNPGEKIMGMSLPFGGHLTHGWKVNFSGRFYENIQYPVGRDGFLDYEEIYKLALREKPKIIVAGATAYPRVIDFKKFASIAYETEAYLMADISHVAGLIAAEAHPSPFSSADVVTTTTHKTLRGPRGAVILANTQSALARKNNLDMASVIDKAVFPALQGGPHDNQTAAIAVAMGEARKSSFKAYGRQIIKNAQALSENLQLEGFKLVSGGTDNHLLLLDLTDLGVSGKEAQEKLESVGVVTNRNTIPYDTRSPFDPSGLRLGTPLVTSRGMKEKEMEIIAKLIADTVQDRKKTVEIKEEVKKLCAKFKLYSP